MNQDMKSVVRMGCGAVVFVVGIAGLFLPIIPGIPLILLGIGLLFGVRVVRKIQVIVVGWWRGRQR